MATCSSEQRLLFGVCSRLYHIALWGINPCTEKKSMITSQMKQTLWQSLNMSVIGFLASTSIRIWMNIASILNTPFRRHWMSKFQMNQGKNPALLEVSLNLVKLWTENLADLCFRNKFIAAQTLLKHPSITALKYDDIDALQKLLTEGLCKKTWRNTSKNSFMKINALLKAWLIWRVCQCLPIVIFNVKYQIGPAVYVK